MPPHIRSTGGGVSPAVTVRKQFSQSIRALHQLLTDPKCVRNIAANPQFCVVISPHASMNNSRPPPAHCRREFPRDYAPLQRRYPRGSETARPQQRV